MSTNHFIDGDYTIRGTLQKSGKHAYYDRESGEWYEGSLHYVRFYFSVDTAYRDLLKIIEDGDVVWIADTNSVNMSRVRYTNSNINGDAITDLEIVQLTFEHVEPTNKEILRDHIRKIALDKLTPEEKEILGLK